MFHEVVINHNESGISLNCFSSINRAMLIEHTDYELNRETNSLDVNHFDV